MHRRRTRFAFLSACLALLAVFGMSALSGWHGAMVHDEDPVHATTLHHGHPAPGAADPDAAIHGAAHTLGSGLPILAEPAVPAVLAAVDPAWVPARVALRAGREPLSPLRPPKRAA